MKTELKTVYVFLKSKFDGKKTVEVTSDNFTKDYCCSITGTISVPLCEMEVEVPVISDDEANKIMAGAMLETLIAEREKMRAEHQVKMNRITQQIEDLQSIEYKG